MTTLKRITILYFSTVLVFTVIGTLFGGRVFVLLKSVGIWILPFFVIAIGQTIGFVVSFILERPQNKQKVFNVSYLLVFIGFAVTTFYFQYTSWRHERDYSYIEDNQKYFEYFIGPNKIQEKIAFDSLSKILVDPNSFLLTGGSLHKIDTVLNGISDTLYLSTLRYKKRNQKKMLKAQFLIWQSTAKMIFYDIPLDKVDKNRIDSLDKVAIRNFNDAMKGVPDSARKEIKKDFGDIMDK